MFVIDHNPKEHCFKNSKVSKVSRDTGLSLSPFLNRGITFACSILSGNNTPEMMKLQPISTKYFFYLFNL